MEQEHAIIIGAGPAGLTAAYELLARTGIKPIVLERSGYVGGLSCTLNYEGNRIDLGGHRFFSKSDRVMEWWLRMLPLEAGAEAPATLGYHGMRRELDPRTAGTEPRDNDRVMLLRRRTSRIYYLRRFFDYPISLGRQTLRNLGPWRAFKIGVSYLRSALFPLRPEATLDQFLINRFGRELYETFFRSYTEKVWGVPCDQIDAQWGAQRIKGLSVWATLLHAAGPTRKHGGNIRQQGTETSLIEQFLYPKYGPGQMWEETTRHIRGMGGEVRLGYAVSRIVTDGWRVKALEAVELATGQVRTFAGEHFFSTAPMRDLMRWFDAPPPAEVLRVSDGLVYRDLIIVGLLVRALKIGDESPQGRRLIADNWIYIHEPDVQLSRVQIFNNWSPHLVADPTLVWLGLEYSCNRGDALWNLTDVRMTELATRELSSIGIIENSAVLDATVIRADKTYPAYFGTYGEFATVRDYVDRYVNLFLIGRNGMHRYNNQDHSMLTAMVAVDNIVAGRADKSNLWAVNTEAELHEEPGQE